MIPIGDSTRSRRTPFVNYAVILANIAVFFYTLSLSQDIEASPVRGEVFIAEADDCYGHRAAPTEVDDFFCRWSFQPAEWFDNVTGDAKTGTSHDPGILITIVTAMFMHAGWLHVGGNMLFLWVFGDNVEDRLGHIAYALFFVLGGIVASLIQGLMDPGNVIPVVGASGAVAAVLGAYIVWFPRATVFAVVPLLFFVPLPIPAVVMIGLWFLQNLLSGYATLGSAGTPDAGVAWFAHIGGFLFGFLLVLLFLRRVGRRRLPPPPRIA